MMFEKVDMDLIQQSVKKDTARQLTDYINNSLSSIVTLLPSKKEYVEAFTKYVLSGSKKNGFEDGQALSFNVLVSLMAGIDWFKDPLYKLILDIYQIIEMPYPKQLNIAMYQANKSRNELNQNLLTLHETGVEFLQVSPQDISTPDFYHYRNRLFEERAVHKDVNIDELCSILESDFLSLCNITLSPNETTMSHQERWARKNMGLTVEEEKNTIQKLIPKQRYALLLHTYLSLCYGRFYLHNPLYQDLHLHLNFTNDGILETRRELLTFLIGHKNIIEGACNATRK